LNVKEIAVYNSLLLKMTVYFIYSILPSHVRGLHGIRQGDDDELGKACKVVIIVSFKADTAYVYGG
jgi:hypothetical protein